MGFIYFVVLVSTWFAFENATALIVEALFFIALELGRLVNVVEEKATEYIYYIKHEQEDRHGKQEKQ